MTKRLAKFQDFVYIANLYFMSIGIHPYSKQRSLVLDVIFYFSITNLTYHLILLAVSPSLLDMSFIEGAMTMAYTCFALIGECKIIIIWRNKKTLTDLIHDMQELFPKTAYEQQELYQLDGYLQRSRRIMISFSSMYMILIWLYNLFGLLQYLIYDVLWNVREVKDYLPYNLYFPYNHRSSDGVYYATLINECIAGYISAAGQISGDLLLCSLTMQVVMHFDYLARHIKAFQVTAMDGKENLKFVKHIIDYHVRILSYSDTLNEVFGLPLIFNFLASSCGICFVGFQMTMGVDIDILIKLFMYLMCSMFQVYLICHYSQLLIDASSSVSYSCFEQNWFDGDVKYQQMLVLIIKRSQKPADLMATRIMHISRGTMTEIMQISYKFFALLRTMYAQ